MRTELWSISALFSLADFRFCRRPRNFRKINYYSKMLTRVVRPVVRKASAAGRSYHAPTNFKPTTMDELPVPQGSWQEHYNSKQRKYNMHLLAGLTFFGATFGISAASGLFEFNLTPPLKNK